MAEFLLCEHVLRNRTFLRNVELLSLASMKSFEFDPCNTRTLTYWEYLLNTQEQFNRKEAFQKVDELLKQSMKRISDLNPGKTFSIGLSGGYDSRLAVKYALDSGVNLTAFVYDHLNSDACYISKELAKHMGLSLKPVNIKDDYMSLKDIHVRYNPMHNIMYAAFATVSDDLPRADVMLSGFLGGELFGNHIRP